MELMVTVLLEYLNQAWMYLTDLEGEIIKMKWFLVWFTLRLGVGVQELSVIGSVSGC